MFKSITGARKSSKRILDSAARATRRDVYHRRLLCEPLEDRRLLAVSLTWPERETPSA